MEIKERLISIRKHFKLTQADFAKKLKFTQSSISRMESGDDPLIDQNIQLICLTFKVNEKWLRTGEGPQFNDSCSHEASELLQVFDQLSPEGQDMILEYAQMILKNERILRAAAQEGTKDPTVSSLT